MYSKMGHKCCCECHGDVRVHVTVQCDCGGPIKPPKKPRPSCPPPEPKCQPGTVDIPQPPPFTTPTSRDPYPDRPSPDDPAEIPWFRGAIGEIGRKGPAFGPRKDEFLPFLVVRATSGDRGGRPFNGVFWESPDIFVAPNLQADAAPLRPPATGGIAVANVPNTLYAHIWNLGKAPAYRVRVEFYWFNPSLGFSRASANLIGATWIDLANRFTLYSDWQEAGEGAGRYMTRGCHAIVRCPNSWLPQYENNGHECLVVRAFEPILDSVPLNQFSPAADRHVGQRNIAVQQAASPAAIDLALDLGYVTEPGDVEVDVEIVTPASMEWLQLYRGRRVPGLQPPKSPIIAGFLSPTSHGVRPLPLSTLPLECREPLLRRRERFHRGCDPVQITFHAGTADIHAGQAQVLRIRQRIGIDIIGGYSVVLVGRH